ncbi:Lrp/AsnC family transcriptional regulator [Azospirillum canadense]|uniref:Lrp/AsnC family transcriptional regulator n=1 Tax=Azospirillum canadense TaxID=403962 RepID=UPI002226C495|nr:Lrp/AsnC family transcriptional regulator [Azospirillum canadense]MCW2240406.1 DNA-binding Lrp family transcriptional regulator [Azospirillum canadense]
MDDTDRKILAELQKDGRLSVTELGDRIGLSLSPCHRRVRALEQAGVIRGYRANIDPASVGLTFSAIVFVTLREANKDSVTQFENALWSIQEITDAQRLFGDPDYMVHVVTKDLTSFQRLYDERLSALPSVLRLTSTLVMKSIFQNRPLPI